MAELKWVGPAGTGAANEIPTVGDLNTKKATALTTTQIDSQVASGLTGYSLKTYVDSQDATKALKTYVDTQDGLKILKTLRGAANGPVPLDGSGFIPKANLTNTYPTENRSVRAYYSPASYAGETRNVINRDQFKFCADIVIPDPGYRYKIVPFGYCEVSAQDNTQQAWPEVRVKVGSTIIGWGRAAYAQVEGNMLAIQNYDPTDATFTGSQTVQTWAGRYRWGSTASSTNFWLGTPSVPPKLILYLVAA